MVRENLFKKVTDSGAEPYIEQKHVILCRSGIQLYHKSELLSFISDDNKPAVEKEWYREYRPANVVVKAKKLCRNLPVTEEHPDVWVSPDNWKILAGGTTGKDVEVVALDGEAEGEIGLESDITFYAKDLYEYYENNKEVSLGYTCKKHFVDNPEEVGYDIILDEITEVNHVAITKSGRGGSSVAVIDSLIGGMKPMRTGIFAWLAGKKQKDSSPDVSFGKDVFTALKKSKGTSEEELAAELKGVLDSCAVLKDCKQKETMLNMIKDCYDNREKALEHEDELTKTFDSMYVNLSGESCKEITDAVSVTSAAVDSEKEEKSEEEKSEDSEKEDEAKEEKSDDSDEKKESEEEKSEDACGKDEKKDDEKSLDSAPVTRDEIAQIVKDSLNDSLKDIVSGLVKETLGIKETKDKVEGSVIDTNLVNETVSIRDYSEFLE